MPITTFTGLDATVFDRTADRGRLVVAGADRLAWLHGLLTQDIRALVPGAGAYAALLTPQGRMASDLIVLLRDADVLIDLPGATRVDVLARLDQFVITEDVDVRDLTEALACVSVQGPRAAAALDIGSLPETEYHHVERDMAGVRVRAVVTRELGGAGVDLYVDADRSVDLLAWLDARGLQRGDAETWHHLRVLAGRPAFGIDMTTQTIPLEAGLETRAISSTKGCYLGQEIIVRMRDIGHGRVARRLVGLRATDDGPLTAGSAVQAAGADVGAVTSATRDPAHGTAVALATVHRDHAAPGTALTVVGGDGRATAVQVVELPFA